MNYFILLLLLLLLLARKRYEELEVRVDNKYFNPLKQHSI